MKITSLACGNGWQTRWLTTWQQNKDGHQRFPSSKQEFRVFPSFLSFSMFGSISPRLGSVSPCVFCNKSPKWNISHVYILVAFVFYSKSQKWNCPHLDRSFLYNRSIWYFLHCWILLKISSIIRWNINFISIPTSLKTICKDSKVLRYRVR